jgi:hypothetical protein
MAAYGPVNIGQAIHQLNTQLGQISTQLAQHEVQSEARYNNLRILGRNRRAITGAGFAIAPLFKTVTVTV